MKKMLLPSVSLAFDWDGGFVQERDHMDLISSQVAVPVLRKTRKEEENDLRPSFFLVDI